MKSDQSEKFELLLDLGYQQHVIGVLNEWCDDARLKDNAGCADLVHETISEPLLVWADETQNQREPGVHYDDIDAAREFAIRSENIVYILQYNTRKLYPEHVSLLSDAWTLFQRSIASNLYVQIRLQSTQIVGQLDNKAIIAKELQRMADEDARKREVLKREEKKRWQEAGVAAAIKYTENDKKAWLETGRRILEKGEHVKSVRDFARKIQEELCLSYAAAETIRKNVAVVSLFKKHSPK